MHAVGRIVTDQTTTTRSWQFHHYRKQQQISQAAHETYVGVELPNKAGEVVVLEVVGKQISGELRRSPHHKGGVVLSPRHNVVSGGIIHQIVSLGEKRSRHGAVAIVGQQAPSSSSCCLQISRLKR